MQYIFYSKKVIYTFRPRYIIMVGIAAGIVKTEPEEQMYGDVIVPDVVWNYAAGKFVNPEKASIVYGNLGFLPALRPSPSPKRSCPTCARRVRTGRGRMCGK